MTDPIVAGTEIQRRLSPQDAGVSLADFFALLFDGVQPELYSTIVGFNGKAGATFIESFTVDAVDKFVECVDRHRADPKTSIYFRTSYLAEKPAQHRRGDEDATVGSNMLWIDLDFYNTHNAYAETLNALEAFSPKPTVIWSTGRGIQAVWKLREFCTDKYAVKAANKWLETQFKAYGADNTSDLTRVYRVPTTFNHRTDPPTQACIVQFRLDRFYDLGDFGWQAPEPFVYGEPVEEETLPVDFLSKLRAQSSMVYDRVYSEDTARKAKATLTDGGRIDRSKNDWFVVSSLLSLGYTKGQIMSVLTHPTWFSGARFRERKNYYYINLTIQKASATVDGDPDQYFIGEKGKRRLIPERMYAALVRAGTRFLRLTGMEDRLVDGIWYYSDGYYNPNGEQYIREECVQRLGLTWASRHAEEVIKYCRSLRSIPTHSVFRTPEKGYLAEDDDGLHINTRSGLLNVKTGLLRPHTPDEISFIQVPVRYNPERAPGMVDAYIRSVLPEDAVDTFYEFVGYSLIQDCRFKKALFLIGQRDSSKSTLLDLVKRFLGRNNTISTSLQDICDGKFDTISLLNKLANIYPDLDTTELGDVGKFKAMTSGDAIKGERKFENPVSFYPTAKHIYSANAFVATSDPEVEAFVNRWIVISMPHVFRIEETQKNQRADTRLIDKLDTPENMSELLNLALVGLRRLLMQDHFTEGPSVTTARNEFHATLDSVYACVVAETVEATPEDDEGYIPKDAFYHVYSEYCAGATRTPMGKLKFYMRMKHLLDVEGLNLSEGIKKVVHPGTEKPRETSIYKGRRLRTQPATPTQVPATPTTPTKIILSRKQESAKRTLQRRFQTGGAS